MKTIRTIFVIDDDVGFRKTLSDILKVKGYLPIAIDKGQTALSRIQEEKPIVALIDLRLEDMSGLELMELLKEHSAKTECIVLTGYASQSSVIEAINLGAYGYMQKPYDIDQLLIMIRRAIEKSDTEEALRKSENRYRTLFNSASDAIFIHNEAGEILEVNEIACDRMGYRREKLLEMSILDISPTPAAATDSYKAQIETLRQDNQILFETVHVRQDGTAIPVEVSSRIVEYGQELAVLSIVRDISDRKKAEEDLQNYAAELERSNTDLQNFAYGASHDLQEPLRKIQAFGSLLSTEYSDALDETGLDYMERMQNAASRMEMLIQDLLTLSRVATKAQPFKQVDLNMIVQGVLLDLETQLKEVGGQVDVDNLPTILVDNTQMRQLFQNLISNALKFHRPDEPPMVKIGSGYIRQKKQVAAHYQITIEDNGIGFDDADLDLIFGVFQRLHTRHEYEGTGVGLAICLRIVERHGGTITAKSTVGQGSVFVITLPA